MAVCALSHTLTLSNSPSFFSLSCLIEMPWCLTAIFKWWSEEESFQPLLMLDSAQDKETCQRVLFSRPQSSITLLLALPTALCIDERQNKQQIKHETFQSTALQLQIAPPCFWCWTDSELCCSVCIMPAEGSVCQQDIGESSITKMHELCVECLFPHISPWRPAGQDTDWVHEVQKCNVMKCRKMHSFSIIPENSWQFPNIFTALAVILVVLVLFAGTYLFARSH